MEGQSCHFHDRAEEPASSGIDIVWPVFKDLFWFAQSQ